MKQWLETSEATADGPIYGQGKPVILGPFEHVDIHTTSIKADERILALLVPTTSGAAVGLRERRAQEPAVRGHGREAGDADAHEAEETVEAVDVAEVRDTVAHRRVDLLERLLAGTG